jgi:hypothetical protein
MAITVVNKSRFQVKVKGTDGRWITRCFETKTAARNYETELRGQKRMNGVVTNNNRQITLDEYYAEWSQNREHQTSLGWRLEQDRNYRLHVRGILGSAKLHLITPHLISKVLVSMAKKGKSPQTQLHVFNLLRKMFGDAIELFQLITFNPAFRSLKPKVPFKETKHLSLSDAKKLLSHALHKPYGSGIWFGLRPSRRMISLTG